MKIKYLIVNQMFNAKSNL